MICESLNSDGPPSFPFSYAFIGIVSFDLLLVEANDEFMFCFLFIMKLLDNPFVGFFYPDHC